MYQRPHASLIPWVFAAAFVAVLGGLAAFKVVEWTENEWAAAEVREAQAAAAKEQASRTATARRFILANLRQKGIVELSEDSLAGTTNAATGETIFVGRGKDEDGRTHEIGAMWKVAAFAGKSVWQCEWIMVDDKIVYKRAGED